MMLTFRNYVHVRLCLIGLAVLHTAIAEEKYEGDPCKMKNSEDGICQLQSNCNEIMDAIKLGTMSASDPVHCSYWKNEEVICCPPNKGKSKNVESTTTRKPTILPNTSKTGVKTTTTTEKPDFWLDLLKTTTTTTAQPDFWQDLLTTTTTPRSDVTTTTTSAQPDFWQHLLTSTTTPKPLVIGGKELDTDAEYIDLNQILQNGGRMPTEGSVNQPQLDNNNLNVWNSNSNNQRRNNGRNSQLVNFPSGPNQNHFNDNRRQIGPRQNNDRNMLPIFNQPNQNGPDANRNWNSANNWNNNPNQPNSNINWNGAGGNWNNNPNRPNENMNWNGNNARRDNWNNNPNNIANQNQNIPRQGNQVNWPNGVPFNGNFPNSNRPNPSQQSNTWTNNIGNNPNEDLETAASTNQFGIRDMNVGLPNGNNWANTQPAVNPIDIVYENLVKNGMDIVKAKVDNVERLQEHFHFPQDSTTVRTTTFTDPLAPFQFRPQPVDVIVDTNNNDPWKTEMQPTNQRPLTTPTPGNRISERAAITACREIEAALSPVLTQHILDGTPVELGEYPHMAAIGYAVGDGSTGSTEYEFRCGGTLISNKFVLTAAHCLSGRDATPAIVRLGAADFKNPEELRNAVEIKIKNTFIHPNYSNSKKYDDIALMELENEITVTEYISPTCLYTELADPPTESQLYVTGWGTINTRTREQSKLLLKARLHIVPLESCNSSYLENGPNRQLNRGVIDTQMCAGDPEFTKDACQGDSGGPLNMVVDAAKKMFRIVGVISTGFGCASSIPGLYTRVASYLDFIEHTVWPELINTGG